MYRRDVYQDSFRPARALGQGLSGTAVPTRTLAARKNPEFNRRVAAHGGTGANSSSFPSSSSSRFRERSDPRVYDPWGREHDVYWGRDDDHGRRERDEDSNRWEPENRSLLPSPTYVLRRRGGPPPPPLPSVPVGLRAARKVITSREEDSGRSSPSGVNYNYAARKQPGRSSHRSVRFELDRPGVHSSGGGVPGSSTPRYQGGNSATGTPTTNDPNRSVYSNNNINHVRSPQAPRIHRSEKTGKAVTPAWHAHDNNAYKRKSGGGWEAVLHETPSRGNMISAISAVRVRAARKEQVDSISVDDVARGRVGTRMRVRREDGGWDSSDSEMSEDGLVDGRGRILGPARIRDFGSASRQQVPIDIVLGGSPESSEEVPEESPSASSESEKDDRDEQDQDRSEAEHSDREDDFDSLFVRAPTVFVPPAADVFADEELEQQPTKELVDALESLTLPSLQMQRAGRLPFLPRRLRQGFEHRCHLAGVPTRSEHDEPSSLTVVYEYREERYAGSHPLVHEYQRRIDAWLCPLCEIHGQFKTREMLAKHLEWDHSEVTCSWQENGVEWRVVLTLPHPEVFERYPSREEIARESGASSPQSSVPSVDARIPSSHSPSEEEGAQALPAAANDDLEIGFEPTIKQDVPRPSSLSPSLSRYRSETMTSTTPPTTSAERTSTVSESSTSGVIPVYKRDSASLPPDNRSSRTRSSTATTSTLICGQPVFKRDSASQTSSNRLSTPRTRPISASAGTSSRQVSSTPIPDRFPPPPPPDGPFGPSIRPPYLPAVGEGYVPAYYSCRPGGPRLYDLLNVLPMDDFGVLAWSVIDKEEDIFEVDDLRDQDKVMQALWARWIFLNRNYFLANYLKGTLTFINQYWLMIHRAAGWEALRNWLLVMVIHQFLTDADVAQVLKHYESYTGMEYWCKIVPTDPSRTPPWNTEEGAAIT